MADTEGLSVRLTADDAPLRRGFMSAEQAVNRAERSIGSSLGRIDGALAAVNARTEGMVRRLDQLAAVAGAGTLGALAQKALAAADAWTRAEGKLALYSKSADDAAQVHENLFRVAQRSRAALEPTIGLYASLATSMDRLGKTQDDAVGLTETINKTFKISGTEAGAAAGAITQLAQALGSGVLRGDEFNSVMEAAPRLAQALADGLRVPREQLRALAEQGQLTADKVVDALLKQSTAIDAEYKKMGVTVSDAMTMLGNAAVRLVGRTDQALGATARLSQGVVSLADNLDAVAAAALATGGAVAAVYVARGVGAAVAASTEAVVAGRRLMNAWLDGKDAALAAATANLRGAQAQLIAARAQDAVTGGFVRQRAAIATLSAAHDAYQAALARSTAGAVALSTVQTVASRAMAGLNTALAFVGGPVGAAFLAAAGAVTYFATAETEAEKATRLHEAALRSFDDSIDRSTGKVKDMTDAVKALRVQQLEAARDAAQKAVAQQETFARAGNFKIDRATFDSGLSRADAAKVFGPVRDLQQQFLDGKLGAEELFAAIDKLARQDERLKPVAQAFAAWAEPLTVAKRQVEEADARLAVLNGTATEGQKTLIGLGEKATAAAQPFRAVGAAVADLAAKLKLLAFPEGFERRLAEITGPAPEPKVPVVTSLQDRRTNDDDVAFQKWQADQAAARITLSRLVTAETKNETTQVERQAAGQKLLAGALTATAKAHAENRVALAEEVLKYPALGAATANTILTTKDFGTVLKTLPPELQSLWGAMEKSASAKLSGEVAQLTQQMQLQADAADRLAAAAGAGEAAQRAANYANKEAEAAAKGLISLSQQREANLREEAAAIVSIRNDTVRALDLETANTNRLTVAMAAGGEAYRAAQEEEYRLSMIRKLGTDATKAGTDAQKALNDAMEAYRRNRGANDNRFFEEQKRTANDNLTLARRELDLMGQAEPVRERALASLRIQQQAAEMMKSTTAENVAEWVKLQEQIADVQALKTFQGEVRQTAANIATSLAEKMFEKGGSIIDWWRNLLKRMAIEIATQKFIMPVVQTVVGAVPGLFGIQSPAGAGGATGAQQGGGWGNVFNQMGQAAGGSQTQGLIGRAADYFGYGDQYTSFMNTSLGFGGTAVALPAATYAGAIGATSAGSLATTGVATAGSLNAANGIAGAGNLAYLNAAYSGTTSGAAATSSMTVGGAMGAAGTVIGGAMAAYGIGGALGTATNSKAVGAAGGAAVGAMYGTMILPGWGTAIGAVIGAILGAVGTQKKSSLYGGAYVETDANGKVVRQGSGADSTQEDNLPAIERNVKATSDVMAAIAQAGDLTLSHNTIVAGATENGKWTTKLGGWQGPVVSTSEDPAVAAAAAMKYLINNPGKAGPTVTGNADVITALRNSTAQDSDTLIKHLDYAITFRDRLAAMTDSVGLEDQAKKTGKQASDDLAKSIKEFRDTAVELKLDVTAANTATKQWVDTLVSGADPKTYTTWEAAAIQMKAQWDNMQSTLEAVGYTAAEAGQKIKEGFGNNLMKLKQQATAEYNALMNSALGRDYLTQIGGITGQQDSYRRNLVAVGYSADEAANMAASLVTRQVEAVLKGLSVEDLTTAAGNLGSWMGNLAQSMLDAANASAAAAKAEQWRADTTSLAARANAAVGRDYRNALYTFDAQAFQQVSATAAAGGNVSGLMEVLAVERARTMVEQVGAAIDKEISIRERSISVAEQELTARQQLATSLRQQAAGLDTDASLSKYDPLTRLQKAEAAFRAAFAVANDNDPLDEESRAAAARLDTLGRTAIEAEKAVFATTRSTTFDEAQAAMNTVADRLDVGATLADQQLKAQQDTVSELKKLREKATAAFDLDRISTADLSTKLTEATTALTAAVSKLSPSTTGGESLGGALMEAAARTSPQDTGPAGEVTLFGMTADGRVWRDLTRAAGFGGEFKDGAAIKWLENNPVQRAMVLQALALHQQIAASRKAYRLGGIVGGYEAGGIVGNGLWNVDSVRARYAGGGEILLAGGEHVTRATAVNDRTLPVLDAINRTGRVPMVDAWGQPPANDRRASGTDGGVVVLAAAVDRLGGKIDELRSDMRSHEGAAQGQRSRIAVGAEQKLDAIKSELEELPRRIAAAGGR
ncbi:tape measure protein [Azospirillum sp.]|uniref:tape measure protein n=1 Tax=Azospirillum sp. TaxID=34012 RepID=UPI003D71C3B4